MGAMLSAPITSKHYQRKGNQDYRCASCSMQGYRKAMEDAHNIELEIEGHPGISLFGVYDGCVEHSLPPCPRTSRASPPRLVASSRAPHARRATVNRHGGDKASEYVAATLPGKLSACKDPTDAAELERLCLDLDAEFLRVSVARVARLACLSDA